jgi:membrane protease YdiL (CAAX protease family)
MFPYFFSWECLYLLQFFGLEFFFRGFMIHGLKDKLGIYSVFVMTIPYCMIHFGKPLPECVGSIGAGLFLGMMSYKTGSVWMGAFLHMAVAISMDVLSLWHRGYF